MSTIEFAGDSLSDLQYPTWTGSYLPSGQYAGTVMTALGAAWTRVGQDEGDPYRAAIAGTTLDDLYGVMGAYDLKPYGLLAAWSQRVARFAPDMLIIWPGANDYAFMGGAASLDTWDAACSRLFTNLSALAKRPYTYVIGQVRRGVNPTLGLPSWCYSRDWLCDEMDGIMRHYCRLNGARFVPISDVTDASVTRDGTHLTPEGQQRVAGRLLAAIGFV